MVSATLLGGLKALPESLFIVGVFWLLKSERLSKETEFAVLTVGYLANCI